MTTSSSGRLSLVLILGTILMVSTAANAQRQMENLGRGVVAVRTGASTAYVGWRMLGTDPSNIGFNLYRSAGGGAPVQLTANQTVTTDYVDSSVDLTVTNAYFVRPVLGGVEQAASASYILPANTPIQQYLNIPLSPPAGGTVPATIDYPAQYSDAGGAYTYSPNDCSVADLDGDGEYEIIVKWDPSNSKDNSQEGYTGPVYLDAYKLNGTRLWRINLGPNIRAGAHYTQFMVYDLDGDGKAEVACKTAPGTVDGVNSNVFMPGDDTTIVYTNGYGYILNGPEYLTIFNGQTGAAMWTTNYVPPRGNVSDWGDSNGNRVDRFLACVAYLDGQRPSLVMCRGYYTRAVLAAWDWRNGQLTQRWVFDTGFSGGPWSAWKGQGDHALSVADVDGDGKDEIIYGAAVVNHDGTGLYSTGWGHGDALHVGDMDPTRPGLEVWNVHETPNTTCGGGEFRDADSGALIWGLPSTGDTGRGCADNIVANRLGYQMWAAGSTLYDIHGNNIGRAPGSDNFLVWWDADVSRELLDGTTISKYGTSSDTTLLTASGCSGNNSTKNTPNLSADIFGDWREEVIWRTSNNSALRIYTTTTPSTTRFYTFMHDPEYRAAIAWQNVAYNQPPHTGFYVGYGMAQPPIPPVSSAMLVWHGDGVSNTWDITTTTNWYDNWQLSGIWASSTADVFNQGNTVLFDLSGSNNIPINLVGALTAAVVTVYSPIDYVFGGSGSLDGTTTVVKAGTGMLTINNTNGYTGATTIRDGRVFVNGSLDQSPVTVSPSKWGLGMIGGSGWLKGGLTAQAGTGVVPGSTTNVAGTLSISNGLTEAGGVVNYFDLTDDPTGTTKTNDLINVVGNLNLSGTNTIAINLLGGKVSMGTYPLINYSGTLSGGPTNLVVSGIVQLNYLTNLPGQIAMVVLSPRGSTNLTWTGSVGSSWDTNVSSNWWNGVSTDRFYPMDSVLIPNSAVTTLSLVGALNPASVTVNATVDYTFGGGGTLSGSTGLTKTNTAMLTISTTNTYTGVTLLNGGTLSIARVALSGVGSPIGAATSDPANLVIDGATLRYTGATASTDHGATLGAGGGTIEVTTAAAIFTLNSTSVGSGGLTKIGSGALSLGSSNAFSGGVTLNAGTLTLGNANAVGSGILTLNAGTLNNNATINNTVNAAGTTTLNSPTVQWNGPVTGSGTLTVNFGTISATFTLNGSWAGFNGTVNLASSGGYFRWYSGANCLGASNGAFNLGSSTGTMNVRNAGTINLGALSGGAATVLTGASSVNSPTYYVIGGRNVDSTYSGRIADGAANGANAAVIIKVGTGTLMLTGTNTYNGGTTVSNGTLLVNNGKMTGTGSGTVFVATGGTLGGTGAIAGVTTVSGTLSPGNNAVGTLNISNSLVLNPSAVLKYELGTTSDRTLVSSNLTLDGTLNVVSAAGFGNGTYTLFTYYRTLTTNGTASILSIGTTPNPSLAYTVDISTSGSVKLVVGPATAPVASFTGSPTSGTAPLSVTFNDTSTGSITNRYWDFGDGTTANATVTYPTHAYALAGTYTVSLTASGPAGVNTSTRSSYIVAANPPPPVAGFTASPTNGVVPLTVTFNDTSTGSITNRFWNFGDGNTTNTLATSMGHPYAVPGTFTVALTVNGLGGVATSTQFNLISVLSLFQTWQQQYFGCTGCPQADPNADPDGDGLSNQAEFLAGTNPTNSLSGLQIISTDEQGDDVTISWTTAGSRTNAVQATAGDAEGGYDTNFTDISGPMVIPGSGDATTNYLDVGGVTNTPTRYYRIRLVP